MKKEDRSYRVYLEDILTAINRIGEYIEGYTFVEFKRDYKTVDAVIRNFGIDYEIIWDVAINYLPQNKSEIEDILKKEK